MTPQQQTYLRYGIGSTAAALAVYFLFFKGSENGPSGGEPTGNGGINPGYNFDAHKVATDLWEVLMKRGFAGAWVNSSDAETIIEILTPVNQDQFAQVIDAYGKLNYNPVTGDQTKFWFVDIAKYGLVAVLKEELPTNTEVYRTLKSKFPKYL